MLSQWPQTLAELIQRGFVFLPYNRAFQPNINLIIIIYQSNNEHLTLTHDTLHHYYTNATKCNNDNTPVK